MTIVPDQIRLNESHTFHVQVRDNVQHFAGELSLSREKITLKVMGEEYEERKCGIRWGDIETLSCTNLNSSFLLIGLKCTSGMGSLIEHYPKQRSYFETHFEVDKVIYFPSGMTCQPQFVGFQFQFKALPSWLGNTVNQEKIIQEYKSGSRIFDKLDLLDEFNVPVADGILGVHYSTSIYYSSPEFRAGIILS